MQKAPGPSAKGPGPEPLDPTPTLNNFVRATLGKGESGTYADQLQGLGALKSYDEKQGDVVLRLLSRLLQYGHLNIAGVQLALQVLPVDISRDEKALMRIVQYLVLLGLGDGAAGTPLPVPPQAGGCMLAKAVDRLGLESLVAAWNDLGNEKAAFGRKQAALRALAAVTRASLTSRPEDGTYVAGLYETLRGLLDKMDSLRAGRRGLAHFLSQAGGNKKKNALADIRQRAEMWGLMRVAFGAARLALPRSGLYKVAQRSLSALGSSDPVCARHALALASLVARDPAGAGSFIAAVEPLLRHNVDAAKRTGALHLGLLPVKRSGGDSDAAAAAADSESHLNLRDTWARIYLARACAAVIQSGHIAGDVAGRGAVFWQALLLLAVADPSERVAMEAIRAMFGAPYPKATSAAAMRQPGAGTRLPGASADVEAETSQSKILGASWHLAMTQALEQPPVPEPGGGTGGAAGGAAAVGTAAAGVDGAATAASGGKAGNGASSTPPVGGSGVRAEDTCMFGRVARRLMRSLQSRSHSLVCGAARCVAVLAEARAWFHAMSGGHGHEAEPELVRRWMRSMHGFLLLLSGDDSVSGCERAAALEALVWSQGLDQPPTLSPGVMLKAAGHGGLTAPPIARYTFADPWPEPLLAEVLGVLGRRLRCSVGLSPDLVLELAGGLAAGSPTGMPREALAALWDMAPGPLAVRAALQLLGAPLPPLCQPPASAAVEVKALACQAEAAFHGLKAMAATWLGEHVNSVAGEYAWKPWEHKLGTAAAGDPGGLTLAPSESGTLGGAASLQTAMTAGEVARRGSLGPALSVSMSLGGGPGGGAGAAGGGGSDDGVSRLAVAGVAHNPLLALAVAHLHRALLTGSPMVRVACAQAIAKVAVRSGEPYRIQCYSLLAAAVACGGGGSVLGGADPLGLAPVAAPALEVLDAMYAGELVLERHVGQYGTRPRGWPAPALESLRRRHEWLLGAIAGCVCAVPRELFLPLGPRSRRLIYPNEKEEAEEEARAAAALAPAQQQQPADGQYGEEQQYDEYGQPYQYDYSTAEQYDYGDYYGQQQEQQQQDPYGLQQDALARYDLSGQKAAAAVELNWGGEQAAAYEYADQSEASMVAESRAGVVLYSFHAENEDEVSVAAGDHVRVLHDLGEWFTVAAPGGGSGLVPASYVQLQDEHGGGGGGRGGMGAHRGSMERGGGGPGGGGLSTQSSFGGGRTSNSGAGGLQPSYSFGPGAGQAGGGDVGDNYNYQYDNPEYDAGNASGAYGSYYGEYGGGQYGGDEYGGGSAYGASAYGGGGGASGMYGEESGAGGKKKGGFGGFDDFGAVLAEAKTAAATLTQPPSPPLLTQPSAADNSSYAAADAVPGYAAADAASPANAVEYGAASPADADVAAGSAESYTNAPWQVSPGAADADASPSAEAMGGRGTSMGVAVYEFAAEMEGELSVAVGEELELMGEEVDGWYSARSRSEPSRSGLIPASYVQLRGW